MSTSRAIKPKRDDTQLPKWEATAERAPSVERADRPTVARILAMIGLFLLVLGILAMAIRRDATSAFISPAAGFFFATIGLVLILFHVFAEHDMQFRRLYGFFGVALIAGGVVLKFVAFKAEYSTWFALGGVPALFIGLIIIVAVARNETDAYFRMLLLNLVGGLGTLLIAFAISNGIRASGTPQAALEMARLATFNYLPGEGAILLTLGLLYICAYIGLQDATSERGYYAALGLGGVGLFGLAVSLIRIFGIPYVLQPQGEFLIPSGLILMGMSLVYLMIAVGTCVDWPIVVLTRRDLAAYFFSPVAYLVFIGQTLFGWLMFLLFVVRVDDQGGMPEPIVGEYIFNIFPVIVQMFFVPALTMRLFSEEKRTGTLEVLLTAPVNEISVVLGKFFACWIFYLLLWIPWWLFMVSLRYMGGEEFDYRPVLSFMVAMAAISAGFLSMGVFFSALTSNQIVAAVLTFAGMMGHLALYFFKFVRFVRQGSPLSEFLNHVNFLDFWMNSLDGQLSPRYLVLHFSIAVFFLFATVKVLESRKWQ